MQKNIKLIICGVILVSFLLISSSTLVQNVRGKNLLDKINGLGKNNNLSYIVNDALQKLKKSDENFLKKQALKMISFLESRFFRNVLNCLNLDENIDEKIESLKDILLINNNYKNYNRENKKNTVTVCASTLKGVEEIEKEMSAEEVKNLTYKLKDMKEALRIIDSTTSTKIEKKEANKIIDDVYHYLKDLELLPNDMEKQEAIDLITGKYGKQIYENLGGAKFLELMRKDKKKQGSEGNINNTWCSVSCDGYAHITYLAIDPWLFGLGSIPRMILISPILILLLFELPFLVYILLPIYIISYILLYMGYPVEDIIIFVENIIDMILSTLEIFLWAFEPGYKLMYLHHKLISERNIVGCASMTNGNLSVTTQGLFGSKKGTVTGLQITGFIGLWIESNIQEPKYPDYEFTSTLSCNGYALNVHTPYGTS